MSTRSLFIVWPDIDDQFAREVVTDAMRGYFRQRHARVAPFIDRHLSLIGSARLHRKAIGWDLLRAPANLALAIPNVGSEPRPRDFAPWARGGQRGGFAPSVCCWKPMSGGRS